MKVNKIIGLYFIILAILLALDYLWLGIIAKDFYQTQIGFLINQFNWIPAIVFYLIYAAGLEIFIILPNLKKPVGQTTLKGGILGLIAYSAYDLTNLATIDNWPYMLTIADMLWGVLLSLITTLITASVIQIFIKR